MLLHTEELAGEQPMTLAEWADMDEDEPGELVDGSLVEEEDVGALRKLPDALRQPTPLPPEAPRVRWIAIFSEILPSRAARSPFQPERKAGGLRFQATFLGPTAARMAREAPERRGKPLPWITLASHVGTEATLVVSEATFVKRMASVVKKGASKQENPGLPEEREAFRGDLRPRSAGFRALSRRSTDP